MLQIIGTKKCILTKKALRYCKERSIEHQFVDLLQRSLSDGEWTKVFQQINSEDLIDSSSLYFKKQGYSYREYEAQEELLEHPELLKTPLLKQKNRVVLLESDHDLELIESFV
jgi:arsenate reductase-like glutaredoxin family protein